MMVVRITPMMIMGSVALPVSLPLHRCKRWRVMASTSKPNSEQLRSQLDMLHAEAETTRAKSNAARQRLLRLSEAAEKLKRQAAVCVQSGKEEDARQLLSQKKKVLLAMDNSRSRIQLLDQLSAKLGEAILLKESQLIGNIGSDHGFDTEEDSLPVRILPPKLETPDVTDEDKEIDPNTLKFADGDNLGSFSNGEGSSPVDKELKAISVGVHNEESIIRQLKGISSYEDFLAHLDIQLDRVEAELVTVLNVSSFVLNDDDKHKNSKVQQILELLEDVSAIRQRLVPSLNY
ncbi:hypothetical protein Tsubulata_046862 [Turnera subulata]|uniref:GTD-binding domain-containing protein n=1 Tax=Turnera subulata TaxID=218843 RepID=A0A9Q0FU67_9ROSI|nr:hypothetical protein Tsubulata_046862 [Turnera subulata]